MIPGANQYGQPIEDEHNQDDMLKSIYFILSFMVLTDARQHLANLRDLESNLTGIAACFFEAEHVNDIRIIDTPFSKYKGHVAILQHSATEIFISYVGHDVDVSSLLNLPISHIEWGQQGQQYAFVFEKGSIGSPEEIEAVFLETLNAAIEHWKDVRSELASIHCIK